LEKTMRIPETSTRISQLKKIYIFVIRIIIKEN
jgi:hypothetical protein